MLHTVFSLTKGFYLPRKGQWVDNTVELEPRLTNGFDELPWPMPHSGGDNQGGTPIVEAEGPTPTGKRGRKAGKRKQTTKQARRAKIPQAFSDPGSVVHLNRLYQTLCAADALSESGRVLQFKGVSLYKEDVENLRDDEWLNDNDISFVYELLETFQLERLWARMAERAYGKPANPDTVLLLRPSMVFLLALARSHEVELLRGVVPALEKASFIFLPVNDSTDLEAAASGSHWSLVVVSILDGRAFVMDTMDRANDREARRVVRQVELYLLVSLETVDLAVPQQANGSDCGIMVCQLTCLLLSRLVDAPEDGQLTFDITGWLLNALAGRIWVMSAIQWALEQQALSLESS